jgi:hypothetical protein
MGNPTQEDRMTRRSDFTSDQWATLLDAIPQAARAVASAAGSARQTEDELHEFIDLVEDSAAEEAGDLLLGDLVLDLHGMLAAGGLAAPADPSTAYIGALETTRRAGAILSVVAEPVQAEAVRDWFAGAMLRVAAAAREGGVLGVGGTAISPGEQVVMSELAEAFGADPTSGTAAESEGA